MTVYSGPRIVTPDGVHDDAWVEVVGGRIARVGTTSAPAGATRLDGAWLVPGFVDLHMHGGGGHDATSSPEGMRAAVAYHRARGTTRTLVSLMTAPAEQLCEQLGWVADLADEGGIVGAHLEGPFLASARCGAQNREHLLLPDPLLLRKLVEAGRGTVRTITVAPELPGALELIELAVELGVTAAVGHTDASYEEATAGFQAGAGLATHLFNAMGSISQRAPGPSIAALDATAVVELINDGVHVHDAMIRLVTQAAPDRMAFVTDAISASGVPDGAFQLGGQKVEVRNGQARLAGRGNLAGSTLTMGEAFRRGVVEVGLPVEVVVAATSTTPAGVLGLDDVGAVAPGHAADLVLLDEDFGVARVMVAGEWLP